MLNSKKNLIITTLLFFIHFIFVNAENKIRNVTEEEIAKRIKELTDNGALPAFFKNITYPIVDDELLKNVPQVTLSKNIDASTNFFAAKINKTIECEKLALRKAARLTDSNMERDSHPLDLNFGNLLKADLVLYNLKLADHLNFDTVNLTLSNSYLQHTEFLLPKMTVTATYDGSIQWLGMINTHGRGEMRVELRNVIFNANIQYNPEAPPLISNYTFTASIEETLMNFTNLHEDQEINEWLNEFLTKAFPKALNKKINEVLAHISPNVMDSFKNRFKDLSILDFLVKLANFDCKL